MESYEINFICIFILKIVKVVMLLINLGDEINYIIEVYNYKLEVIFGVVVNDILLDGIIYFVGFVIGLDNVDFNGN